MSARDGLANEGLATRSPYRAAAVFLVVLFLLQAVLSMQQMSMTADEDIDIASGYSYWTTRDARMNYEHPPLIKMLATIPLLFLHLRTPTDDPSWRGVDQTPFSHVFLHQDEARFQQILFLSRLSIVCLAIVLALFVRRWASELWGPQAGLAALLVFAFDPNMLAQSRLVTMDLGLTAFTFISLYYLWKWLHTGTRRYGVLTSAAIGCALLSKYSAVALLPICVLEFVIHRCTRPAGGLARSGVRVRGFLAILAGSVLTVVAVYALAFGWHPLLHPGGAHRSLPKLLAHVPLANRPGVQRNLMALGEAIPIPAVDKYVSGVLAQREKLTQGYPGFLMGRHSSRGWWYYYLAVFIMKTPIPLLLFVVLRLVSVRDRFSANEYFLVVPILGILGASCFSSVARGLPYILPLYPFLFVWVSRIVARGIFPQAFSVRGAGRPATLESAV